MWDASESGGHVIVGGGWWKGTRHERMDHVDDDEETM